jgi:hypothetical protein
MNMFLRIMLVGLSTVSVYGLAKNPNFHIKNNTMKKIDVTIFDIGGFSTNSITIPALSAWDDTFKRQLSRIVISSGGKDAYEYRLSPHSEKTTYYLKVDIDPDDNSMRLRPQEGNVFGRTTAGRMGYSLKNNISADRITPE